LAGIPSTPVAFFMLILFIIFSKEKACNICPFQRFQYFPKAYSTLSYFAQKTQVTPLYKKNDPILKTNYRPVSVLCIFSKIFEKILEQQLSDFFENIFNPYLQVYHQHLLLFLC
jgi:hypothetical protein